METNNLKLVGIQDEVKNNMNTDLVKGNISETQLKEKHDSEYYDLGISYNLPLSIGNLNQKVNDVIAGGIDTVANTLSNSNNTMVSSIGNGISNISKPNVNNNTLQPKTDSQSIMNVGNWSDSFKNTTVSYKDDNGFDFSASVNSTAQSVVLTGKGLKYGMIGTEEIVEFGRETLGKMDVPGIILSQPLSAIEGFLDYFVENDSVVINNKGEKAKTGDENYEDIIKSGKHYQVNGINTTEGYATDRVVNPNNDLSQRYNPTSGALGDLIESGLGKLFNWNGYTAMLGSMNREVANDLIVRSNIKDSSNSFHSQGTIIGMGALNILGTFYKDVKIDDSQRFDFAGPAIYRQDAERAVGNVMDEKWLETAKKNEDIYNGAKGKQFEFNHIPTDFVNITTSPTLKNIKDGFKYGWSLEDHNFDTNPLYNKNVRKDGYFDTLQGQRELLEIEIIKVLYDIKD